MVKGFYCPIQAIISTVIQKSYNETIGMTNPKKSTVITSHINADFDALASMLAAQKLYPDSLVVFPGSQEKNLRNFFIQSMVYLLNIINVKEIDVSKIERLVLVDTKQAPSDRKI